MDINEIAFQDPEVQKWYQEVVQEALADPEVQAAINKVIARKLEATKI